MSNALISILIVTLLILITSPLYFQQRKLSRMADEDLERLDRDEWIRHVRWTSFSKLVTRLLLGVVLLYFVLIEPGGLEIGNPFHLFLTSLAIGMIGFGIYAFRRDRLKLRVLD